MAGMDWFRWHHGSVTDPKFQLVAKKAGSSVAEVIGVWAMLLEAASMADERGVHGALDFESLDCSLGLPDGKAEHIYSLMVDRALVDPQTHSIKAWNRRQPLREREDQNATERKRAQRGREQINPPSVTPDTAEQNHVTPSHTKKSLEERRVEEIREEKNKHTESDGVEVAPVSTTKPGAVCVVLKSEGIASVNPSHPELLKLLENGAEVGQFSEAARLAVNKKKPNFAYVLGIVRRQLEDVAQLATSPPGPPGVAAGYETAYQRSMRERVAEFSPSIARRAPGEMNPSTLILEAENATFPAGH